MSNMVITKLPRDKEHPFTVTSNDRQSFNWDTRLSLGACGVLNKVFSLNPENDFSVEWLCRLVNAGRTAVRNRLKELEEFGYLIIEKIRDEAGRFKKTIYHFFECSQQKNIQNEEGEKPSNSYDCPRSKKPYAENRTQLNTTVSLNTSYQKSVSPAEQMDAQKKEKLTALQNQLAEASAFQFLKDEDLKLFITDMIPRIAEVILDNPESLGKLQEIYRKENSLVLFMTQLKARCEKALKNLKFPKAKEKFLKTTIKNAVEEYTLEEEKATPEPEQQVLPFDEILHQMGSHLCELPSKFESEEELFCLDPDERFIEECTIPETFSENPKALEQALRFLCCYSNLERKEFKQFTGTVIKALSEASNPEIIQRLNEINHDEDGSLPSWMEGFACHYSRKLKEKIAKGDEIRSHYAYLKACAVSYLLKESCSGDPFLYD